MGVGAGATGTAIGCAELRRNLTARVYSPAPSQECKNSIQAVFDAVLLLAYRARRQAGDSDDVSDSVRTVSRSACRRGDAEVRNVTARYSVTPKELRGRAGLR
jgi:hypothetical protein